MLEDEGSVSFLLEMPRCCFAKFTFFSVRFDSKFVYESPISLQIQLTNNDRATYQMNRADTRMDPISTG